MAILNTNTEKQNKAMSYTQTSQKRKPNTTNETKLEQISIIYRVWETVKTEWSIEVCGGCEME